MGHEEDTSFMDFGTPNPAVIGSNEVLWLDVQNNSPWWTNTVSGVYFGDDPTTQYAVTERGGFTDTGTSCIIGPTDEVAAIRSNIVSRLSSYATWTSWGEVFFCDERDNMPSIYYQFGNYWFESRPEDYIV